MHFYNHVNNHMEIQSLWQNKTTILPCWSITWTLTKHWEKKINWNYTRMLRVVLSESWKQHHIKQQLYDHLPPISLTIQVKLDTAGETAFSCGVQHIDTPWRCPWCNGYRHRKWTRRPRLLNFRMATGQGKGKLWIQTC